MSQLSVFGGETEEYGNFIARNDLAFYSAVLYHYDYVELKSTAVDNVNRIFQEFLNILEIEDLGFDDVWDIDENISHEPGGEYDANE